MSTDATSFILRFRDLVTGTDETISRHHIIATAEGHVWWGWWKKAGERPPIHELARLMKAGRPLSILLLDSGQGRLFGALCHAVEARPEAAQSPDKAKTPAYYAEQKYFVWFKLSDFEAIEAVDTSTTLNRLTYVRIDEFFEDGPSPFKDFYGKRIYSAQEMIQQNRTVWFTRDANDEDPSHEIALLNAELVRPHHFAQSYFSTSSKTILWISDLHFSTNPHHHAFPDKAGDQDANLWLALENALKAIGVQKLAGVIASGDITWRADPTEFEKARTGFFERLVSSYALDPRQLAVIPGNHDIAFSDSPAEKRSKVTRAGKESEAAYRSFYERLFRIPPNEFLSCGRRLLVGAALPVDVVCLNSSLLQQHPDFHTDATSSSPVFQGQGFLGMPQLDHAVREFKWDGQPYSALRPLRIVVLHHHVVPVTEAESAVAGGNYSMVLDAERLSRWLIRHRVDFVLHGHQHQPFSVAITRTELVDQDTEQHTFRVLGMGSTGVSTEHQGAVKRNTFGLLEFTPDNIAVTYHSLHPTDRSSQLLQLKIPYARDRRL